RRAFLRRLPRDRPGDRRGRRAARRLRGPGRRRGRLDGARPLRRPDDALADGEGPGRGLRRLPQPLREGAAGLSAAPRRRKGQSSGLKPDRIKTVAPALKTILLAAPRGFCAGVVRAVEIVDLALEAYDGPLYVRKEIVHNQHVVKSFEKRGV